MEENGSVELLKVDTKGRVRVPRERREALLAEYDRSSMSAAAFAEWSGIKYPTFTWWLSERRRTRERTREQGSSTDPGVSWVEAVVDESRSASSQRSALVIELGECGARMEVADRGSAALAAEVLRHLGGSARC